MSDADDPSGVLIQFPGSGDPSYVPPPIPDYTTTIPSPDDIPAAPPESPEETTMELPRIPAAPDPATALYSDGISPPDPGGDDDGEFDGEYVQPRSLADRLGDWLEYRLEMARSRRESEEPFRLAEMARKAALLEARTAQETGMIEANGKLQQAMVKAKGDRATARGKADAARSSGSGLGADKGRSKAGGGGGSPRGGGSGPSRNNSGPGPNRPAGPRGANSGSPGGRSPKPSGGGAGPKGGTKGPERPAGGRGGSPVRNGAPGGGKAPQAGSGGPGRGGGNGGGGPKGSNNSPSKVLDPHKPGNRPWRNGSSKNPPTGVSPWKNKPTNNTPVNTPASPKGPGTGGAQPGKPKGNTGSSANKSGRSPASTVIDPHKPGNRPWKNRPNTGVSNGPGSGAGAKPNTGANGTPPKVNLSKGNKGKAGKAPKNGSGGAAAGSKGSQPGNAGTAGAGDPKDIPDPGDPDFDKWVWLQAAKARLNDMWNAKYGRKQKHAWAYEDDEPDPPVPAETLGFTVDRPDRPAPGEQPPRRPQASPASVTTGVRGLPPAPEPHTQRPGTTRPRPSEESSVSNTEVTTPSGQGGLAPQHRTDITFGEFLIEMVNIAIQAGVDQERAESLAEALGKVANALKDMADELADDHNIAPQVTTLITDLAEAAGRMKQQAQRCAAECNIASEAAKLSAGMVGKVYGEDMDARKDAGLKYASSATHHD